MNEAIRRTYVYQDRCPEGTAKLAAALAKAIPNMQPLVRNCISHYAKKGPDGKLQPDYADLAQCHKSTAKALAEQGLVVIQTMTLGDGGDTILNTQMLHSSGEWLSSVLPVRAPNNDPQKLSAAVTYARRTAYCAIVGIAADDDDNGTGAQAAAVTAVAEDSERIAKLLSKKMADAPTPDARAEVLAQAVRGVGTGAISNDVVQRLVAQATALDQKSAGKAVANGQH